jgi:chromosome segregation ATPase
MGHRSPVDELVDGLDAIGTILDESLPQIKARLAEIEDSQSTNTRDVGEIRRILKENDETFGDLKKAVSAIDVRLEELMATVGAFTRRMDQLQKSMLDIMDMIENRDIDNELADTVKTLEDRLKRLEVGERPADDFRKRF